MALVLLPCDLPTWPTLQRHLNALKREVRNGPQLKEALLKIYNLCNTSLEPDDESMPDQSVFDALCDRMMGSDEDDERENWMSEQERREFFDVHLPTMADYALQLKSLKPVRGLHYSLQQQSDRVEIDRRLAASLVAHAFFSTFPRRTVKTHPTLLDFNLAGHFFHHLHRRSQRAKLRAILLYFKRLSERPPEGHVTFCRQVMSGREWCTLDEWLQCHRPLCPLVVRHDGRVEQPTGAAEQGALNGKPGQTNGAHHKGVRVCFASRRLGATFLEDGTCQESAAFGSHPELLAVLPYAESLEDNEAMSASGLCTYSIIHDLKNKAGVEPPATNSARDGRCADPTPPLTELPTTSMCLIDAEDYSDLPVRQYEEDNVLRELNKAYLAFRQHYPETTRTQQQPAPVAQSKQRLPPVGSSRDSMSSESSEPTGLPWKPGPNDHGKLDERNDWVRSRTLVASSGDPSSPRPSICPSSTSTISQDQGLHQDTVDGRGGRDYRSGSGSHPTMLYGGGRNVPLTLTNATVVKQLVTPPTPKTSPPPPEAPDALLRAGALFVMNESRTKVGSVYASCHSQDGEDRAASLDDPNSSADEFRSANTSLDDDEAKPAAACPEPAGHRADDMTRRRSVESDVSSENRAGSLGFALEGSASRLEEDSFSGDGLEREKRWLECFRERRGGARSNSRSGQKDSPFSSRDSSRYSFSTEFSSELDELYDQFSHWLDDPASGENNGRNTAVFRFAHSLLKRALSDSFASVALNIENLPDKKMKDIKLSSSAGSSGDGPSEESLQQRRKSNQRSWSLADRTGNERLALQLAKEMVEREAPEEQLLPMPDIVPLVPVGVGQEETEQEAGEESDASKKKQEKLACQLNERALQSNPPLSPHAERVVLLDRMSPIESVDLLENHREAGNASEDEKTACDRSGEDSDSRAGTVTPMNPTPPRTRRGSWFFKKSREQRHHPSIKHQRARSNSVPTVMELAQLQLFQQRMAATSLIPDIIVSGENTEDDECFTSPLPTPPPVASTASPLLAVNSRRHRSYDDKLQSLDQSSESLLSDDVVEGFSWTLAETIIEDIMKEIGTKQAPNHAIPHPVTGCQRNGSPSEGAYHKMGLHSPGALANKKPGKSILKISSSDSLNRSHSGSLVEQPIEEHGDGPKTPTTTRPRLPPVLKTLAQQIADQQQNQSNGMSWSQRSTSMPSLCAVDECDSSGTMIFTQAPIDELESRAQASENEPLPLITGNWGCGSSCAGDAQLKSMLQWMAASRAGAPYVVYHTAGAPSVVKLDIVCRVIMDRQWTVSDLASAVLRYCRCRLDPCRLISRLSEAEPDQQSAAAVWSSRAMHPHHGTNSLPLPEDVPPVVPILTADRHLFDELLGQYPLKQTEL